MVSRPSFAGAFALAVSLLSAGQLFGQSFDSPSTPPPALTHEGFSAPPSPQPPGDPTVNPYTDGPSSPPGSGNPGPPGYPPPLTGSPPGYPPPPGYGPPPTYGPPPGYAPLPAYAPPP